MIFLLTSDGSIRSFHCMVSTLEALDPFNVSILSIEDVS